VPELIAAVGVASVVVGWFVARQHTLQLDRERERLALIRQQLDEFYAPIYGILLENDRVRMHVWEQTGRRAIMFGEGEPLDEEGVRIWVHYLENYLIPNNRKILSILQNKMHLYRGLEYPNCFRDWVDYALGYEALHSQYRGWGREYGFVSVRNFPTEFLEHIVETMSDLMREQRSVVA